MSYDATNGLNCINSIICQGTSSYVGLFCLVQGNQLFIFLNIYHEIIKFWKVGHLFFKENTQHSHSNLNTFNHLKKCHWKKLFPYKHTLEKCHQRIYFWKNSHYIGQNTPIHPKPNILDYPRNCKNSLMHFNVKNTPTKP